MIQDVATLLKTLADAEARELAKQKITHAPTIGAMYEGLTAQILERAIPSGLDLRVERGFIAATDDYEPISGQIDCMLVHGEGRSIPFTSEYVWHVKDVVAVLEVKKKLFSKDLEDAFTHLGQIGKIYSAWDTTNPRWLNLKSARKAFAEITGCVAPSHNQVKNLPISYQQIYHMLVLEQFTPIRIILGYDGFKSEYMLRKKLIEFLNRQILKKGYGVPSLPQLIVANNASLIKLNGHPYWTSLEDGKWLILGSSTENPLRLMLELIWTRLSYLLPIEDGDLFGEDLEFETISPLIWAEAAEFPNEREKIGWRFGYHDLTPKQLSQRSSMQVWKPAVVDTTQFTIFRHLCDRGDIDITEPNFASFINEEGYTIESLIESLIQTHMVALDGNMLRLITYDCTCAILPDGRFVVADNNTGRLTRWINKFGTQK